MKIQKGIVKYKDRNDIVCTYGVTDDGKQYYFLSDANDKKIKNGNRIASTLLVEAVDPMVKASNVGMIDASGNVVIPFQNKSIKLINDSIVVVERANPESQSVKDAIELRNDPLSATKLVSTPAAIKDKLYAKMGNDARFVFNDQFSEATICDINGNNLVNNEFYSFIAVANNKLYFSKNTIDSPISEYSLLPSEIQSNVTPDKDKNNIDVSNVNVASSVVENAMSGTSNGSYNTSSDVNLNDALPSSIDLNDVDVDKQDISETPSVPEVPMVNFPSSNDMALPQVEEDSEPSTSTNGVEDDILIEYDDSISKVVDETAEKTDSKTEEDTLIEYDDSISKVVDESAQKTDSKTEEDTLIEYDDSISKVVDESSKETIQNQIVEPIAPPVTEEENNNLVSPNAENVAIDEIKYDDVPSNNSSDVNSIESPLESGSSIPKDVEQNIDASSDKVEENEVVVSNDNSGDVNSIESPLESDSSIPKDVEQNVDASSDKDEENKVEVSNDNSSDVNSIESPLESDSSIPKDLEQNIDASSDKVEENKVEVSSDNSGDVENILDEEAPITGDDSNLKSTSTSLKTDELDNDISSVVDEISGDLKKEVDTSVDIDIDELIGSSGNDRLFTKAVKPDRIETSIDDFDALSNDYKTSSDTIMTDIAKSMTELMRQNREQRALLAEYQEKFDVINAQKKVIVEKYKDQVQKLENIASKYRNLETTTSRLETRNQLLESKVAEQDRLINAQERELGALRPQLQGKEDLVKLLADAKVLLGDDDSYI